jgi:hypothetical protein
MKTGKHPAMHTAATMRSALVLHDALRDLPEPPINSQDWGAEVRNQAPALAGYEASYPWGLALNDRYGCCVFADWKHQQMLWSANTGTMIVPPDSDVLVKYEAVAGFDPKARLDANGENPTDQGASEVAFCDYLVKTGDLTSWGSIDARNTRNTRWAIELFGTVKIGIAVPDFMESYFNIGKVLDIPAGWKAKFEGGHDIPLIKYAMDGQTRLYCCVTWGREMWITERCLLMICDEVHAPLSPLWTRNRGLAPGVGGLDFAVLNAILKEAISN